MMIWRRFGALCFAALVLSCASAEREPTRQPDVEAAALLRSGRVEEAREAFLKAAHNGDDHYVSWLGVAHCEARLGRGAAFENAALRAAAQAPRTVRAQDRLGRLYIKAAERFRGASRGRHYAGLGVEYLRRVFAAEPQTPALYYNLGLGLALTGDDAAARILLEQAHRDEPTRADIAHIYLLVLRRLERADPMLAVFEKFPDRSTRPSSWDELESWARSSREKN